MSNPKTIPYPPKPVPQNGWVHKCDLDDYLDRHLPIPTQVVSNEEYYPLPQTQKQKAVEHHLLEMATRNAKKLGIDRREFLRSACGMAEAAVESFVRMGDGSIEIALGHLVIRAADFKQLLVDHIDHSTASTRSSKSTRSTRSTH